MPRTSSPVTLRVGSVTDLPATAELWDRAHLARGARFAPEFRGAVAIENIHERITKDGAVSLLAESGGQLAGMLLGSPARDDHGKGPIVPGLMHVSWVATDPLHWGRGIATQLMEALMERARDNGFTRMQLWTHANNVRAQRVYERLGFTASGRTFHDSVGEEIWHYARDL